MHLIKHPLEFSRHFTFILADNSEVDLDLLVGDSGKMEENQQQQQTHGVLNYPPREDNNLYPILVRNPLSSASDGVDVSLCKHHVSVSLCL